MKNSCVRKKWSKHASVAAVAALAATLCNVAGQTKTQFTDLSNHVAEQSAIGNLVNQGIMHGVSATEFNPDKPMSRGDFAVSMQKMFGLTTPPHKTNFTDVPASSPIYSAVQAVVPYLGRQLTCFHCQLGTTFGPNQPASRLLTAVTLTNILVARRELALMAPDSAEAVLRGIPDAEQLQGPVRAYVATALQQGILSLTPQHAIEGLSPMTRAATAMQLDTAQKKFNLPRVRVR